MKTCPNCKTEFEENVVFCPYCGERLDSTTIGKKCCPSCGVEIPRNAQFCPACGTVLDIYAGVELRKLEFICGYNYGNPYGANSGRLKINTNGIRFDWGKLVSILTLGLEDPQEIELRNISKMGIIRKFGFYILCIEDTEGDKYYFSNRTRSGNKEFAIKIAYLIELYRRMYWWYDEYRGNGSYGKVVPIGDIDDAVEDISSKSNEELIEFYQKMI